MNTKAYLEQLQIDKQTLIDNLNAKGVIAQSDETFTSLTPKVAEIEGEPSTLEYMQIYDLEDNKILNYSQEEIDAVDRYLDFYGKEDDTNGQTL